MYKYRIEKAEIAGQEVVIVIDSTNNNKMSVFPKYGASLNELVLNGSEILRPSGSKEDFDVNVVQEFSGTHLFPFPNRIKDGKYTWEGKVYQFPINDQESHAALHGFIYNKPFEVVSFDGETGELRLAYSYAGDYDYYPFPFELSLVYTPKVDGLFIYIEIQNSGETALPLGYGFHPYFNVGNVRKTRLELDSENTWSYNSRFLPIAPYKEDRFVDGDFIGESLIAWCYDMEGRKKIIRLTTPDNNYLEISSRSLNFCQLYTPPDKSYFAIEPQSCLTDSFNNEVGLKSLTPDETCAFDIRIAKL